jgi:hypothetical protein
LAHAKIQRRILRLWKGAKNMKRLSNTPSGGAALRARLRLAFMVCLLGFSFGCTAVKLPSYTGQPVERYPNVQIKNGLAVATHPLTDKRESKNYFGLDLVSADILAIYVSVENRSPSSNFILLPERTSVRFGSDKEYAPFGSPRPKAGPKGGPDRYAVFATIFTVAAPLVFADEKQELDAGAINFHLFEEEFSPTTLAPAGQAWGFVYFQIPGLQKESRPCVFHFEGIETKSRAMVPYDFALEINRKE